MSTGRYLAENSEVTPERKQWADELLNRIDSAFAKLYPISDEAAAIPRAPGKWSKKEIIGHLIDSAANNHQRFVRAQQNAELVFPTYAQDAWVRIQDYRGCSWHALLAFWQAYNHHLAGLIRRMPSDVMQTPCRIGDANAVPLAALVEDYVRHLDHHLRQLDDGGGR